jgi:Zn-dependent alcohol dehydrogenase
MVKGAVMHAFNEPLSIESMTLKPPREDESSPTAWASTTPSR